ncbi:hypothetical protein BGX27_002837 [Mortierella sp. AM989]|nr:hypothetical protein BGX27_002837 [Mortierella sp. AM989]
MTAMTSSSLRSIRAPLRALAQRQYSSAASTASHTAQPAIVVGHSNQKLAIASGVSAMVGVDATYAYFTFFQKKDASA